jgi:gamma-glutamyl hercynylcysteine S-oxide synthase
MASVAPDLRRTSLLDWYARNRRRSAEIFGLVADSAFYSRPIALRHPFVFYEGHIPAFSFLTVNERALGESPIDPEYERLFERGIDPGSGEEAARLSRSDWPTREAVQAFGRACDARVERALAHALEDPAVPRLVRGQAYYTALEHEPMHHETLLYLMHQLDYASKTRLEQRHRDSPSIPAAMRPVAAGIATLGAARDEIPFGWDNEFGRALVDVPAFAIDAYPVTNGDWLRFVADGGPVPAFWFQRDGAWYLRAQFDDLPLPRSWPVYVTHRLGRKALTHRGRVPSRRVRDSGRSRARLPLGRRRARSGFWKLRFPTLRSRARRRPSRRGERLGRARFGR